MRKKLFNYKGSSGGDPFPQEACPVKVYVRNFAKQLEFLILHKTANKDSVHETPFTFSTANSLQLLCFRHDLFSFKEVMIL